MFYQQGVTNNVNVEVRDTTDNTLVTGLAHGDFTFQLSKAGATIASFTPASTVSEIGQGVYRVAVSASDIDTVGSLLIILTATGAVGIKEVWVGGLAEVPATVDSIETTVTTIETDLGTETDEIDGAITAVDASLTTQTDQIDSSLEAIASLLSLAYAAITSANAAGIDEDEPGLITIVPGVDYDADSGTAISFDYTSTADLIGGTVTFEVKELDGTPVSFANTGAITEPTDGNYVITISVADTVTATLAANFTPVDQYYSFQPASGNLQYAFRPSYTFHCYVTDTGGIKHEIKNGLIKVPQV